MFTPEMYESIKKVEATREARMATEPRRMTADEKSALLKAYHPDYREEGFAEIKIGPNKGQKAPFELTQLLHSNSRILGENIDLTKCEYDVDVLLLYSDATPVSLVFERRAALIAEGKSVSAQRSEDVGIRYKEVVDLTKEGDSVC